MIIHSFFIATVNPEESPDKQLFAGVLREPYQPTRNHTKTNEYQVLLNKGYKVHRNEQHYGFVVEMVE